MPAHASNRSHAGNRSSHTNRYGMDRSISSAGTGLQGCPAMPYASAGSLASRLDAQVAALNALVSRGVPSGQLALPRGLADDVSVRGRAAPARNVTPDDAQLPVRLGSVVGAGEVVDAATAAAIKAQRPRAGGLVMDRQGKRAFRLVSGDPGKRPSDRTPLTLDEALQLAVAARRASKLGRLSSGARVCLSMSERACLNLSVLPKVGRNPKYGTLPGNGDARWTAAKRWTLRIVGRAVTARAVVAGWRAMAGKASKLAV